MTRFVATTVLTAFGAMPALAAPPANNNFAARINLGSGETATRTGTTVEATLEAGEINPGEVGGASVWYRWTAPVSDWVTVDTVDASADSSVTRLDTVIAVYTGSTLAGLQMLGFNDGTQDPFDLTINETSAAASRLTFRAVAGTTYSIAVHGSDAGDGPAQGTFTLCIAPTVTPDVVISSIDPDPVSVNATSITRNLSVSVGSEWSVAFNEDYLSLGTASPASALFREFAPSSSASVTPGVYFSDFDVDIPAGSMAGSWPLAISVTIPPAIPDGPESVSVWTAPGADDVEDSFLVPDIASALTVVNTGVQDATPPELTAISVTSSRDIVNPIPVAGAPFINVTVRMTIEDAGKGFSRGILVYQALDDDDTAFVYEFDSIERISGNASSGVYQVQVPFEKAVMATTPGVYIPLLILEDAVHNESQIAGGTGIADMDRAEVNVFNGTHPYKTWTGFTATEHANATTSGPAADPDKDGVPNAIEYALGRNPKVAEPAPTSASLEAGIFNEAVFLAPGIAFNMPEVPVAGARCYVEASGGLGGAGAPWITVASLNSGLWRTYANLEGGDEDDALPEWITEGASAGGFTPVTVRYPTDLGRGALRLKVEILLP